MLNVWDLCLEIKIWDLLSTIRTIRNLYLQLCGKMKLEYVN